MCQSYQSGANSVLCLHKVASSVMKVHWQSTSAVMLGSLSLVSPLSTANVSEWVMVNNDRSALSGVWGVGSVNGTASSIQPYEPPPGCSTSI